MVRKLIGVARPAPFGRGERTVRDARVRDTWEIARSRVKVDQRLWRQALAPQFERTGESLGLAPDCRLDARLHKLLVYAPGQFFRAHQNSEKSDELSAQDAGILMPLLVSMLRACRDQMAPSELRALGLAALVAHCIANLTATAAEPVRQPDDWSIEPPMVCDCALCKTLGRFLANREQARVEWPLAKDGRRHVHNQIDGYDLPVSHVTRRVGRPFTLVLAKQKTLFTREKKRRAELEHDLAWLRRERRNFA